MKRLIIFILLMNCGFLYAGEPSGKEILEKIDRNYDAKNRVAVSKMIIKGRRRTRTLKAKSWGEGTEKTFTEYLAPAREKGTKMLKLKDELWIWSPSSDRIIKIAGHMLRQSMMGSDVSYEDFMEDPKLGNNYNVRVEGTGTINKRPCYILKLTAKTAKVTYYSRKLWVDKERYLPLKEELFTKSGKLLKKFTIEEVFKVGDRWYPQKMTFKDVLKKGDGTQIIIDSIEFDVKIPKHMFTKASLRR